MERSSLEILQSVERFLSRILTQVRKAREHLQSCARVQSSPDPPNEEPKEEEEEENLEDEVDYPFRRSSSVFGSKTDGTSTTTTTTVSISPSDKREKETKTIL